MRLSQAKIRCFLLAGLLVTSSAWGGQAEMVAVNLDHPDLHYVGIRHVDAQPSMVGFSRFDPDLLKLDKPQLGFNPLKARNTTGGLVAFKTDSSVIRLGFRPTKDLNRGSEFAAFIDGRFFKAYKFDRKQQNLDISIEHEADGKAHVWEVSLPSFSNVQLVSLEIAKHSKLEPTQLTGRKVYVALGDSITHGTGQGSATHLTWPFVLSRKLDYTLYNLAVGGSGVSVAAGESLAEFESIDLITILFGYNDWNGEGDTAESFRQEYDRLLEAIYARHPDTPVFCISPLATRRQISKSSELPIDGFREVVRQLVEKWSKIDSNIHFIAGESISSEVNLREEESGDPVHLSVNGAALLAATIYPVILKDLP